MFTSNDFKALPNECWFHLFATYLQQDWEEFHRACAEYEVNHEYAMFVCRLGDRILPRRQDDINS